MTYDGQAIQAQVLGLLDRRKFSLSTAMPSEWAQSRMHMSEGNFQGALSHDITPYWTEILDNLSPYSGYEEIVLMGASQGGKTKAIIEPTICYYISEHPCNIGYISGNTDLALESMIDLDKAIKNANLAHLIRPSTERIRNSRTGDTNKMKEYPGGNLIGGSATNHKTFRRRNWRLIIGDDIEEANDQSAKAGSTVEIIKKRANSYGKSKKIFWCSTPMRVQGSIIYPLYLKGDQRKYHIPCQRCGAAIHLEFEIKIDDREKAGIRWQWDTNGKLKPGTVEYVCQECGKGFSEKNKYKFNKDGLWVPTAEPDSDALISYYWNNLYSAPGMDNWDTIVREYISACPLGQPIKEKEFQTFQNLRMGLPFEPSGEAPKATSIQRNCRNYKPGEIPEQQSIRDGNGPIIMLTLAADMNGIQDKDSPVSTHDVRLDYEVKAWSAEGPSYSILHGSIGTFQRGIGKDTSDRKRWTYEDNKENSVWPEFEKAISQIFHTDSPSADSPTGFRRMRVELAGLDCGHFTSYAYAFLDKTNLPVVGIKGEKEQKYIPQGVDAAIFRAGTERKQDYILQVGLIKDKLSENMGLNWDRGHEPQPTNFMNFPEPNDGLYLLDNYFSHFESEKKQLLTNKDGSTSYRWEKINGTVQNHMWDCAVYNIALRDIIVSVYANLLPGKPKGLQWRDYVNHVLGT